MDTNGERKEIRHRNDVNKIRADQARMSSLGETARLLSQEMVIKREEHLVHTEIIVRLL